MPSRLTDGTLSAIAAALAIAGFEVGVDARWSDGQPAVLAITSLATGACAEGTVYGTELVLRWHSDPADLKTAQVTAILTARAGNSVGAEAQHPGAGPAHRRTLFALPRTELTWPELMPPGRALAALRTELDARSMATAGMIITRLQGILSLADGPAVGYRCGWLFWPAGRLSRDGRPLYAVHCARDPAGAARRLALRAVTDGEG